MIGKTWHEIISTLYPRPALRRRRFRFGMGKKAPPPDPRSDILVEMVLDLMMEVEALRTALLALDGTAPDAKAGYARAYRDTAYMTHNANGRGGLGKLLSQFYPTEADPSRSACGEQRTWRESLMLNRLGFSDEQIRLYKKEAERAELFT